LSRVKDILGLILIGAMASTAVSASIGVTSLCIAQMYAWPEYYSHWWLWWFGDGMGNLVVASFILSWSARPWIPSGREDWINFGILGAFIAFISLIIFTPGSLVAQIFPPTILVFP